MSDFIELKSLTGSNHSFHEPTAYPKKPHATGRTFSVLQAGTVARTDVKNSYVYASDISVDGVKKAYEGDKWWRVKVGGIDGWIAEIDRGVKYLSATLIPERRTPQLPTVNVQISDESGNYPTLNIEWKPKD